MTMMKFMKPIQTLAALLMAVAATTSCSSGDTIIDEPINEPIVKPEAPKTYTMTVQATMGGDAASTRALAIDDVTGALNATWKKGETVAVYSVTGTAPSISVSDSPVGKLTALGNGATVTLSGSITGITPTADAKLRLKFSSASNYNSQKGTLAYIADYCDYATADVTITDVTDSKVTTTDASFENQQAIVKFSLKNKDTDAVITTQRLLVKCGSNTYSYTYDVKLTNASSDIYVAIPPKENKTVTLNAISDNGFFIYEKSGVTFKKGKYYTVSVKMTRSGDLSKLPIDYKACDGDVLTGTLNGDLKLSIADGATVTLNGVNISANEGAGITCEGNANIILSGTNSVTTAKLDFGGIQAGPANTTLTISGSGSLTATGAKYGAGIGGGNHKPCGAITINGGTVTAAGGDGAAGIGSGCEGGCGNITITNGATQVKATRGSDEVNPKVWTD